MQDTLIATFEAYDDEGNAVTIHAFQEWHDATTMRDTKRQRVKGMRYLKTSEGLDVNFVDPKTFKIVQTGQILRSKTELNVQ